MYSHVDLSGEDSKNALWAMALAVTKSSNKGKIVLTQAAHTKLEEKCKTKEQVVKESTQVGKGKKTVKSICDQREQNQPASKKRHYKPGTVALCKIRWFQKSTELLICFLPFAVYVVRSQGMWEHLV